MQMCFLLCKMLNSCSQDERLYKEVLGVLLSAGVGGFWKFDLGIHLDINNLMEKWAVYPLRYRRGAS